MLFTIKIGNAWDNHYWKIGYQMRVHPHNEDAVETVCETSKKWYVRVIVGEVAQGAESVSHVLPFVTK